MLNCVPFWVTTMKSPAVSLHLPRTWVILLLNISMSCTLPAHPLPSSCLGYQRDCDAITVLVFKQLLFYLVIAPKCESSEAGNLDMLKRIHEVLPLCENVYIYRKNNRIHRVWYYPWFQASTGGLGMYPLHKRGDTITYNYQNNSIQSVAKLDCCMTTYFSMILTFRTSLLSEFCLRELHLLEAKIEQKIKCCHTNSWTNP